jgi:putative oxidoreductase
LVSVMRFVSPGVGIVLGGLFVYAGIQKHLAPYEFAEAILAYQLLPFSLVGLVAAILSWIEIVSGFSLILGCLLGRRRFSNPFPVGGILRRSALLLILGQSVLFIAVLLITLARGLKIDCGCGLFFQRQVGLESILEDALLLGVAGWLYWREWQAGDREEKSLVFVRPKL